MSEDKVKKRGWIKNVAIIFLAVLLLLTFFSNTLMNRSLPEVAAQYVSSGPIVTQIRGSGTVEAEERYEVKTNQSRTVLSVPVKVGDNVTVGQTLVQFGEADSMELQSAQDALDAAVLSYKQAVVNTNSSDYAQENRDISLAQEALDKSKAERDKNFVSDDEMIIAQQAVDKLRLDAELQQISVTALENELNAITSGTEGRDLETVKKELEAALILLAQIQNSLAVSETTLQNLNTKKAKYDDAVLAVDLNQRTLEDLIFALSEAKKAGGKIHQSEALQIESLLMDVNKKRTQLESLQGGSTEATIESQVNGTVTEVSVSAGSVSMPDSPLMVVEVPDLGYTVSFPVTLEQSKKVKVGSVGETMQGYWGAPEVVPTLVAIRPNPQDSNSRNLVFKLDGDVQSGTQIDITIGERGQNYETIVPSAAIRTDNNGDFVLIVLAKTSPLGNRYEANRVDVKSLASDDTNTAVSGALTTSDFVITTASAPIEPGMLVRLPD